MSEQGRTPHGQLILRAELFHRGRSIVAHTIEIDAASALVRTDEPLTIGDRLLVRLSFPTLLAPLDLEAHVVSKRLASGPGQPQAVTVAFVFASEEEEEQLRRLLENVSNARDEAPAAQSSTFRVLLIEDSAMIREMVLFGAKRFFRNRPDYLQVDFVPDAESAWPRLVSGEYRLAIIDYFLPGMNGAALIERIRSEPRLASLPIVAISVGGAEAREACLEAGADIFLDKPVVVRDLFGTIDRLTASAPRSSRHRILMMDDSPLFLEMAREALEGAGFTVLCAQNLEELERRTAERPDLVLMDVQMPEAFGDDVAMVMRAVRGVNVPIYLLSSLDEDELAARAGEAEIEGFISKSAGVDALVTRVRSILDGVRA